MNATVRAFDRLASSYDAVAAGNLFRHQRERTHAAFDACFAAGDTVLEVGCGTGLDTAHLASRGVRVIACDPSEEMVSRALRRMAHEGCQDRTTIVLAGLADFNLFLEQEIAPGSCAGVVSNFGALNCVEHLAPLRAIASRYVRPGGAVILVLIGRTCAAEALYFLATGRTHQLRRRHGRRVVVPVGGVDVETFYHRIADVRAALGGQFELTRIEGVGVATPPPYLEPRWQTTPAPLRTALTALDRLIAAWPVANRAGDHVLLHFTRRLGHV